MDALTTVPTPVNEPVKGYAPGSPERAELEAMLTQLADADPIDITCCIGGERRPGRGAPFTVTIPSDHAHVLGRGTEATGEDAREAIAAAMAAAPGWAAMPFDERAAIFLRAADLLAGPWRARLNAATMLGQGKTVQQAEIDSACELIDFLRFNVKFAQDIYAQQPQSSPGVWNRMEYRPIEGFVYAITPFNFTAISGNLPTAPAIMGCVAIWKPATSQLFAATMLMDLLMEAGLPKGVINLMAGPGREVTKECLASPDLAGIHFTGSTGVFQDLWKSVGENIASYKSYPRIVGETGGKDFVVAHVSADPEALKTALIRGAFEYSGQKCSAASRAYVPQSLWDQIKDDLIAQTAALKVGDVRDLTCFTSAVITEKAFDTLAAAIDQAKASDECEIVVGGTYDKSKGWFVTPTIITSTNPKNDIFVTEYFGPVLGVYVYPDDEFEQVLELVDTASPYALTGSVFARCRKAVQLASTRLRNTAGNFYVNDKPTGAVVGQQPFGGARASGTNDKAGSQWNLMRWTSPRSIKETLVPPTCIGYPHMEE